MINFTYAKLKEKALMKKVEKAVFDHLGQDNFFVTDIAVVDEDTIRAYNLETRGVDGVTDVLSFPYFEGLRQTCTGCRAGCPHLVCTFGQCYYHCR